MNDELFGWIFELESPEAVEAIQSARLRFQETGAVVFSKFLSDETVRQCVQDAKNLEDDAFTTNESHTPYLKPTNTTDFPTKSVYNHEMNTQVASVAFDELPRNSKLAEIYRHPSLLNLVSKIVQRDLFLSEDPLGCCSINVFRPGQHHSFHFDESEFSVTLMLQEATESGLFQYTNVLRRNSSDLALREVGSAIHAYDDTCAVDFAEVDKTGEAPIPALHTLDFRAGTLSIFSGSRSLHRVTKVEGEQSRLVAVLTFATAPGFRNSASVQTMFWGRSSLSKADHSTTS